jgi:hypothetical protein
MGCLESTSLRNQGCWLLLEHQSLLIFAGCFSTSQYQLTYH